MSQRYKISEENSKYILFLQREDDTNYGDLIY